MMVNLGAHEKIRARKESWTPAQVVAVLAHPGWPIHPAGWTCERYSGQRSNVLMLTIVGLVERGVARWNGPKIELTQKGYELRAALMQPPTDGGPAATAVAE